MKYLTLIFLLAASSTQAGIITKEWAFDTVVTTSYRTDAYSSKSWRYTKEVKDNFFKYAYDTETMAIVDASATWNGEVWSFADIFWEREIVTNYLGTYETLFISSQACHTAQCLGVNGQFDNWVYQQKMWTEGDWADGEHFRTPYRYSTTACRLGCGTQYRLGASQGFGAPSITEQVPIPGTLFLFGLGYLGFFMRRSKK